MTSASAAPNPAPSAAARASSLRYGARLAGAVLLAFGASALLHLPEGFWAVMSALIVVRPSTGSTLSAGWDRVRGAFAGTAIGLGGVWLRHAVGGHELAAGIAPLLLVTLLAFGAGLTPSLRSAPISALIVVTSSGIPGHSAGQVALLRALEIAIGVAAALLVSIVDSRSRATARFRQAGAALLRAIARQLAGENGTAGDTAAEAGRRAAVRELAGLAEAADREERLVRFIARKSGRVDHERHRKCARLLARTNNDAALFARARAMAPARVDADAVGAPVHERSAIEQLLALADAFQRGRGHRVVSARQERTAAASDGERSDASPSGGERSDAAFVLALLADDIRTLARLEQLTPAPEAPQPMPA